jgi:Ca2+-binding RTX toxin-like protein
MSNIDFEILETLAQASQDAYEAGNHNPDHYTLSERVEDPDTGFSVSIYGNDAENSYIFAFSGTEMSVQDVFSDLTLGLSQWSKNSGDIKNLIDRYFSENDDPQLYLTGHSLGGALAQYAAYEYAMAYGISNPTVTAPFKLVTFNALGGELGLKNPDLYPAGYDESITQTINAAHYKITGDIFSRLGGDHIGGELLAIDRPVNTPLGAHPIAHFTTGLSGSGPVTLSEYQSANIEESYLRIDQALGVSGIMASYGDDGQYTEQEALLRTISALAFGLANTQPSELSELVVALFGDASTFGVEEHDAMVLVAEQAILRLQRSRLSVAGANGVAGYALLLANIMQDSTQYWAENPGFADAVGMPIDAFIEYIGKPAAGLISGAMDFALENEPLGEGSQEATLFISKTLEWIDNYVFGQPTNEMFIQGTEADDVLLGKASYWSWETSGDQMFGWGGDDTLDGGAGNDFLEGGSGADSFIWNTGGGNDVIGDYDDAGDRIIVNGIDLGSLQFRAAYAGSPFYRDIQHPELSLYYTGGFLTVNIDTGVDKGEITVTQYSPITGADYGIVLDDYVQGAPINTDIAITQLGTGADEADPLAYWRQQSGQGGLDWSSLAIRFEAGTVANYSGGSLHGTLGGAFEGGPIADHLGGDARDNALHGLGGNDQILGNAGHDFLEGGSGSDELIGGEGSDILFGSARAGLPDILASADAYDQFYLAQITDGPADTNVLDGGAGNDFLSGGEGSDYLSGGTGINYLLGGAGRDHISGGSQQDVIYGDSALNYRYVELSPGVATEQLEIAFAGGTDPVGEYDDIVFAGDGNDIVWGELGDDDLHGGAGDDNLLGDRYNNTAYFNAELPAYGLTSADLNVAMHGNDRLYGDAGNDLLLGLGGNDLLAGGPGSDSLLGGAGDDVYVFAPGDGLDSIEDVEGEHTLLFTGVDIDDLQVLFQGDQVLVGTGMGTEGFRLPRNSWANVRLAADTAEASFDRNRLDTHYLDSAGNVLISLQGANTLEASRDELFRVDTSTLDNPGIVFGAGATQADIVANLDGSATMRVLGGQLDLVVELAAAQIATGFDFLSLAEGMTVSIDGFAGSVTGTDGADIIFGSAASDSIFSGAGNDTLFGRGGDDLLDGGTGQDYIEGGAGDDVIQGGPGSDIFSFNRTATLSSTMARTARLPWIPIRYFPSVTMYSIDFPWWRKPIRIGSHKSAPRAMSAIFTVASAQTISSVAPISRPSCPAMVMTLYRQGATPTGLC